MTITRLVRFFSEFSLSIGGYSGGYKNKVRNKNVNENTLSSHTIRQ